MIEKVRLRVTVKFDYYELISQTGLSLKQLVVGTFLQFPKKLFDVIKLFIFILLRKLCVYVYGCVWAYVCRV